MVLHVTYTSRTRYSFVSKQFFEQRVRELGLQDLLVAMQTKGWDSFAVLAFATEYAGISAAEVFLSEIVRVWHDDSLLPDFPASTYGLHY